MESLVPERIRLVKCEMADLLLVFFAEVMDEKRLCAQYLKRPDDIFFRLVATEGQKRRMLQRLPLGHTSAESLCQRVALCLAALAAVVPEVADLLHLPRRGGPRISRPQTHRKFALCPQWQGEVHILQCVCVCVYT